MNWKIIIPIITMVCLAGGLILLSYLYDVNQYQTTVKSMTFNDVDFSLIPDGTYEGECNVNYIFVKVQVSVQGGELEKITLLEHKNERGSSAEQIIYDMVNEQKVNVDTISGATNSSKVIMKAVENALASAK
jgi:uncharacterized protein with FMN-binding domain